MQVDYAPFIGRVISRYEGGYGWNKKDAGGPTKYGITCFDLADHRGLKMTSMATWAPLVQAMTLQEAEDIYRTKYATSVMFDALPAGPDVAILDYAINSGTKRADAVVQVLTGTKTYNAAIDALHKMDPKKFVDDICAERLRFMHAIRGGQDWVEFGHGWGARVDDLRAYGEHLAAGGTHETAPQPPDLTKVATPKATHVPNTATAKTAGGVVVAGTAAQIAGLPWYGVVFAGVAVLAAGVVFEVYEEHKTAQANALVHA